MRRCEQPRVGAIRAPRAGERGKHRAAGDADEEHERHAPPPVLAQQCACAHRDGAHLTRS